jgi:hypothetical protein
MIHNANGTTTNDRRPRRSTIAQPRGSDGILGILSSTLGISLQTDRETTAAVTPKHTMLTLSLPKQLSTRPSDSDSNEQNHGPNFLVPKDFVGGDFLRRL